MSATRHGAACARLLSRVLLALPVLGAAMPAHATGARHFKSGPIQVTADGRFVWIADREGVVRLDTALESASGFPIADCEPKGIAVREDGAEAWVTCPTDDRVVVLDAAGDLAHEIELPWGSGPEFVALSPDQRTALVTLRRGDGVALVDVESGELTARVSTFRAPLGVAWSRDGATAWVTHAASDGENTFVTGLAAGTGAFRVIARVRIPYQEPRSSVGLGSFAEGGAVTLRGHLAQLPAGGALAPFWLAAQHHAIEEAEPTPDTAIQGAIHRLDPRTATVPPAQRLVLTARQVHDALLPSSLAQPGWNVQGGGPIDLGFAADGSTAWVVFESSEEIVPVPATLTPARPAGAAALAEIRVGTRPTGVALSPTAPLAYVYCAGSREVSVVSTALQREWSRIPLAPALPDGRTPTLALGEHVFHTSALAEVSRSGKVSCGSCHFEGEHDGLTWHFEHLATAIGPRPTTSMLGLSLTFGARDPVTRLGQLHRAGDRDELQDFEHTFRDDQMGGFGFFTQGPPHQYDGPPNASVSPQVDAMAAYLVSLPPPARSPKRQADGSLSEAAVRGARMFAGASGRPSDAACAGCHPADRGFSDRAFHDVGSARPATEVQLTRRLPEWKVNTPTLLGLWTSAPYDDGGEKGSEVESVVDALERFRHRPHGSIALAPAQLEDLAAYLESLDARATQAELAGARDLVPPRLVRVEPVSHGAVRAWFSEAIDPVSARDASRWVLTDEAGARIDVQGVDVDERRDVVTVRAALPRDCTGRTITVRADGIVDAAGQATGGDPNALDPSDPANVHAFTLGRTATVTLGASGLEHVRVHVHDAGVAGPQAPSVGHDAPWLAPVDATRSTPGFVRFDWRDALIAATGISSSAQIVDVSFSVLPRWGSAQPVEARRVLQSWSDGTQGHHDANPFGAPTWAAHEHPGGAWNVPGAGARGGTGSDPADYGGAFDLAASVDAVALPDRIDGRMVFGGPAVTEAYRFWFDHPDLDHGHALTLPPGATGELVAERWEDVLGRRGPVLVVTYLLPDAPGPGPEVSAPASAEPLRVAREGGALRISFEDAVPGGTYEVFEGALGDWQHAEGRGCAAADSAGGGRASLLHAAGAGSRFVLVAADGPCGGSLGAASTGLERLARSTPCSP